MKNINELDSARYAVIDTLTGTVLEASGLVVVPLPDEDSDITEDDLLSSDSVALDYANSHGINLYVQG